MNQKPEGDQPKNIRELTDQEREQIIHNNAVTLATGFSLEELQKMSLTKREEFKKYLTDHPHIDAGPDPQERTIFQEKLAEYSLAIRIKTGEAK
jgi:hypothetical protein